MNIKYSLKTYGKHLYDRHYIINRRKRFAAKDLENKLRTLGENIVPISKSQKEEILEFWKDFDVKIDFRWFDVYNTIKQSTAPLKYYIPHDIFYCYIDPFFSNVRKAQMYDDKNMYDLYFHDVLQPMTIARCKNGIYMDAGYKIIPFHEVIDKCVACQRVIIKPSVDSEGGHGIRFWDLEKNDKDELISILTTNKDIIVQEVVQQHATLSSLHMQSVNTIRIITLIYQGEVHLLSSILRMGVGNANVDNASSGGIFCGIGYNGKLQDVAYDIFANKYECHPQGELFSDCIIPNFDVIQNCVREIAPRFIGVSSLCSWDFAIDINGTPLLIETNMSYGQVDFHQICNGPIFGDYTPEILSLIFNEARK